MPIVSQPVVGKPATTVAVSVSDTRPSLGKARLWVCAAAVAAFVAQGYLLFEYGRRLWATEHYRFFPLVLIAVGVLAFFRGRALGDLTPGSRRSAVLWWSGAVLLTAAAIVLNSPLGGAVAFLVTLLCLAHALGGGRLVREVLPVWACLWLAMQPPFELDQRLVVWLQMHASAWASGLLDVAGLRHYLTGIVIELPTKSFLTEEACSGIQSLFASLCSVWLYAVVMRRGPVWTMILLGSTVFWVFCANVLRVAAVVYLTTRHDIPVAEGLPHAMLGMVLFCGVLGLSWSVDRGLLFFFPQGGPAVWKAVRARIRGQGDSAAQYRDYYRVAEAPVVPAPARLGAGRYRREALLVTGIFAGLFGLQVARLAAAPAPIRRAPEAAGLEMGKPGLVADVLPTELDGWRLVKTDFTERKTGPVMGRFIRVWWYEKDGVTAAISVAGPFEGWHPSDLCYQGTGWTVLKTADLRARGDGSEGVYTRLTMQKDTAERGVVLFACHDAQDRPLAPPAHFRENPLVNRFAFIAALKQVVAGASSEVPPALPVYQIQLLHTDFLEIDDARASALRSLFENARRLITGGTGEGNGS